MEEESLMTDDEKVRVNQMLDDTLNPDEPESNQIFTVQSNLQKELDEIEQKLKGFQAEAHRNRVEVNANPTDYYLNQRLQEIDDMLKSLTKKKLQDKEKKLEMMELKARESKGEKVGKSDLEKPKQTESEKPEAVSNEIKEEKHEEKAAAEDSAKEEPDTPDSSKSANIIDISDALF